MEQTLHLMRVVLSFQIPSNGSFKYCSISVCLINGNTVLFKVRLLITDGAVVEYVPFINNNGIENPFRFAIHGLCYFHIVIQSYKKNIHLALPESMKNSCEMMEYVKILKMWIKT